MCFFLSFLICLGILLFSCIYASACRSSCTRPTWATLVGPGMFIRRLTITITITITIMVMVTITITIITITIITITIISITITVVNLGHSCRPWDVHKARGGQSIECSCTGFTTISTIYVSEIQTNNDCSAAWSAFQLKHVAICFVSIEITNTIYKQIQPTQIMIIMIMIIILIKPN